MSREDKGRGGEGGEELKRERGKGGKRSRNTDLAWVVVVKWIKVPRGDG